MKLDINELSKKRDKLLKEADKLDRAIKALQDVCEHDWVDDGHDSHHNYGKCKICGRVEQDVC